MWWRVMQGYLAWSLGAHLVWEVLQLPLYTIWSDKSPVYVIYAIAHCTVGDVLIAGASLTVALVLVGQPDWPAGRWIPVTAGAMALGVGYTVYSEWLNTGIRLAWSYSEWMPVVPGLGTGLSPLLQWVVLPPLGLCLTRRRLNRPRPHEFRMT